MRAARVSAQAQPAEVRSGTMFTGTVYGETLMPHDQGSGLNRVRFALGSRTIWHRHEGGQMLIGEGGAGLVVTRSGEIAYIGDGVVVHACPNEEHWHGAFPDSEMTHLSCVLTGETIWLEPVEQGDYVAAVEKARGQIAAGR